MNSLKLLMHIALLTPTGDPRTSKSRWGAPFLLEGEPGTAKTSFIAQVAECMDLMDQTMYLSTHQPEDLSGIPVMRDGKGTLVNFMPQIDRLCAVGSGVLNLDELTTARESTQNAAMNLVLERTIAGEHMPPRIRVVAAANPPEQAAGARDLAPPAANRFLHFASRHPTLEQWIEFESRKSLPDGVALPAYKEERNLCTALEGEQIVKTNWAYAHSKQVRLAKVFHEATADVLQKLPPIGSPDRGHAWASARSWSMGLATMATADALAHGECALDLLTAAVGLEISTLYAEWLAKCDLPHPDDVLSDKWHPDRLRIDIAAVAYNTAALYVLNTKDTKLKHQLAKQLWGALKKGALKYGLEDIVKPMTSSLVACGLAAKTTDPELHAAAEDLLMALADHVKYPEHKK